MNPRTAIVVIQAVTFVALAGLLIFRGEDLQLAAAQGLLAVITILIYI